MDLINRRCVAASAVAVLSSCALGAGAATPEASAASRAPAAVVATRAPDRAGTSSDATLRRFCAYGHCFTIGFPRAPSVKSFAKTAPLNLWVLGGPATVWIEGASVSSLGITSSSSSSLPSSPSGPRYAVIEAVLPKPANAALIHDEGLFTEAASRAMKVRIDVRFLTVDHEPAVQYQEVYSNPSYHSSAELVAVAPHTLFTILVSTPGAPAAAAFVDSFTLAPSTRTASFSTAPRRSSSGATLASASNLVASSRLALDSTASPPVRTGPDAIWSRATKGGQVGAAESCLRAGSTVAETRACVAHYMATHGASPAAVSFFVTTGTYLLRYLATGPVDLGYTLSEFPMDCGCGGFLVLNGRPPYLRPPNPSLVTSAYRPLQVAYERAGGFRPGFDPLFVLSPPALQAAHRLAGGGEELDLQFPLYDACNACATPYRAQMSYRFSAAGALSGSDNEGPCLGPPPGGVSRQVAVEEPACPKVVATEPA